jgi:hypothetical protein
MSRCGGGGGRQCSSCYDERTFDLLRETDTTPVDSVGPWFANEQALAIAREPGAGHVASQSIRNSSGATSAVRPPRRTVPLFRSAVRQTGRPGRRSDAPKPQPGRPGRRRDAPVPQRARPACQAARARRRSGPVSWRTDAGSARNTVRSDPAPHVARDPWRQDSALLRPAHSGRGRPTEQLLVLETPTAETGGVALPAVLVVRTILRRYTVQPVGNEIVPVAIVEISGSTPRPDLLPGTALRRRNEPPPAQRITRGEECSRLTAFVAAFCGCRSIRLRCVTRCGPRHIGIGGDRGDDPGS